MMLKFYGFLIRWAYKMLCVCVQYSTAQTYLDCHKDKNQVWWSGKIEGTSNKRLNSRTNPRRWKHCFDITFEFNCLSYRLI